MENQINESRPYVFIELPKLLLDVMKHECMKCGDGWLVNETTEIGLLIVSLVSPSIKPPRSSGTEECIKIYLPVNPKTQYTFTHYFLSVKLEHQRMIKNYVDAMFRLHVGQWFLEGRQRGFHQKEIINAVISQYGFRSSADNYEMIKKMDYRTRQKVVREVRKEIESGIIDDRHRSENPELTLNL